MDAAQPSDQSKSKVPFYIASGIIYFVVMALGAFALYKGLQIRNQTAGPETSQAAKTAATTFPNNNSDRVPEVTQATAIDGLEPEPNITKLHNLEIDLSNGIFDPEQQLVVVQEAIATARNATDADRFNELATKLEELEQALEDNAEADAVRLSSEAHGIAHKQLAH